MGSPRTSALAATGVLLLASGASALQPGAAQAATPASPQGVLFFSIRVAPDYATSHTVYAAGSQLSCQSSCSRLFRSTDGGRSWERMNAQGWSSGDAWPATTSHGDVLLSVGQASAQQSLDGGDSFTTVAIPHGAVDVTSKGGARAIVVDSGDHWHQVALSGLTSSDVAGATGSLKDGFGVYAAPAATSGTAGIAAGTDAVTGDPAVERCTAAWQCDAPTDAEATRDAIRVNPSPGFAADHAIFVRSVQHGTLLRSTDSGHTFTPVVVASTGRPDVISTVQAMAFSDGFDAVAPRGVAYASVVGVAQVAGAPATVVGGVYLSGDGGRTWQHMGHASELDNGSTAVAWTPDGHVIAAYVDAQGQTAGLLCTVDNTTWSTSCGGPAGSPAGGGGSSTSGRGGPPATPAGAVGTTPTTPGPGLATLPPGDAGSTGAPGHVGAALTHGGTGFPRWLVVLLVLAAVAGGGGYAVYRRMAPVVARSRR